MSRPEDNEPNDNDDELSRGSYAERAAHRFLFKRTADASTPPLAGTYPIDKVRKALWRTVQASLIDGPKSTVPAEVMPGVNDYLLHLMQRVDRLERVQRTHVDVGDLACKAQAAQIRERDTIENGRHVSGEIEAAASLSPGVFIFDLIPAQMAVNAYLADALATPLSNPLPRAELGD